jgi:hypothetical protein
MTGSAKAHYDGIVAFSQTDCTDDWEKIDYPRLVMDGDDDEITLRGRRLSVCGAIADGDILRPTRSSAMQCPRPRRSRSTPTF